jgi:aminoglycoside 6'-N-acetyltransferase I
MSAATPPAIRPLDAASHTAWIGLRQALWMGSDSTTLAAEAGTLLSEPQRFGALLYAVLLAFDGARAIGFIEVSLRDDLAPFAGHKVGYVEGVYVAPSHQRRGIGRALIDAAAAWTRAQGTAELVSDVLVGNDASVDFHHRVGFVIAGEGGSGADRQMLLVRRV